MRCSQPRRNWSQIRIQTFFLPCWIRIRIYNEHGSATWLIPGELLCVSLYVRGGDPALLGPGPRDLSDQGAAPEGRQEQVLHGKRYAILG
jgi:hypothetical protein